MKIFPGLPAFALSKPMRKVRVCIVGPDFAGPLQNGEIGAAYSALAETLAVAGHDVTCLDCSGAECNSQDISYGVKQFHSKGIVLVTVPTSTIAIEAIGIATKSYEIFQWLRQHDTFDIIHFPEWQGMGYYTLNARAQGLAFARTKICVGIHSMTAWLKEGAREHFDKIGELQIDFMERQSIALADCVVSPSQYLLNWIVDRGWRVPATCYVQPYSQPHSARREQSVSSTPSGPVNEIVFYGQLETRKGIALFCDALDKLPGDFAEKIVKVTFLGKDGEVGGFKGSAYVHSRAKNWKWPVQILAEGGQREAIGYLVGAGRLAVIPSLLENSPLTVYECLRLQIPFIVSRVGGVPELIHEDDVDRVCFDSRPAALARKLEETLTDGMQPARAAIDTVANDQFWVAWHEAQLPAENAGIPPEPVAVAWPRVSLCITTFNRPKLLRQALLSVEKITYANLEVIVVDDGSTQADALAVLQELESKACERGWRIVRQENRYLGAARNTAARHSTGEYLLFMDDDNYAEPHEVTTLVRVALWTQADIVSCGLNYFSGQDLPKLGQPAERRWLPLGASSAVGAFCNCFGDANALVKRSCFEQVGGFTEDYGVTHEDWEFHAKAVLKGFKLEMVPEFLFWYRVSPDSMLRTLDAYPNHMRSIRPYLDGVNPELRNLILYAQGIHIRFGNAANSLSPYAQATLLWKSKLEAAIALMGIKQNTLAGQLMMESVRAAESSRSALIILEALVEICPRLAKFDPGRARCLLDIANSLAVKLNRKGTTELVTQMIADIALGGKRNGSSQQNSPASEPAKGSSVSSKVRVLTVR